MIAPVLVGLPPVRCDDDDFGVKYWLLRFSRSVHADFLTIEEMGLRMLAELKGLRGGNP
jgi:hypothetical protein